MNYQKRLELAVDEMETIWSEMRIEMLKGITGNVKAQQRSRVKSIEMRDEMKKYRILTLEIKKIVNSGNEK